MIKKILFFTILLSSYTLASVTDDLIKLSDMFKNGLLTQEEFSKAKSILLQLEEIEMIEQQEKPKPKISDKKEKETQKKSKIVKKTSKKRNNLNK